MRVVTVLFLTTVWVLASGRLHLADAVLGCALAVGVLAFLRHRSETRLGAGSALRVARFTVFYIVDFFVACLAVARQVFLPLHRLRPAVVEISIESRTDAEIALLANLVSYSPGTLCIEVSPDERFVYVHVMSLQDENELRAYVRDDLEKHVLEVLR